MGTIFTGFILLTIGILMRFFPGILAGYNMLSQRERENAIANGLPKFVSNLFGGLGLLILVGYFVAQWLGSPQWVEGLAVAGPLLAGILVVIIAPRFTHDPKRKN